MTRIICDTMIWYYLSQGKLKIPDPEKYTLVCTFLNVMELAFTPNNFRKLSEVQDAVRAIADSGAEFSLLPPFDYARTLVDEAFEPECQPVIDMALAFLKSLLNHPKDGLLENEFRGHLSLVSSRRKENNDEWAKFLNDLNAPMKEVGGLMKKYYDHEFEQSAYRGWFSLQLKQVNDIPCSADTIDWTLFDLYENMYRHYNRKLMVSPMKVDANDKNDMENMIYVQPSDLYWTAEKRWLNIAKEAKIEKYLYVQKV